MKEKDIIFESGGFWVYRKSAGWYEIYKTGVTHSTRVGSVQYSTDDKRARKEAIDQCSARAAQQGERHAYQKRT